MDLLADLALADRLSRNPASHEPLKGPDADVETFRRKAAEASVLNEPEPAVLTGKDLMPEVQPGPHMGILLRKAYDIQIQEGIRDKAELKKRVLG
jgi:hypothetical protein